MSRLSQLTRELIETPGGGVLCHVVGVLNQTIHPRTSRGYEESVSMCRETMEEVAFAQAKCHTETLKYIALRTHCNKCLMETD